ncbi:MAG: outer membrane beta-barrel protein [candidate division Zixibacteria bacterium]
MRRCLMMVLAVALMLTASSAFAFNNDRAGFMLDLGAGAGITSVKESGTIIGFPVSASESKFSVLTNFRIGHGFNSQTQLYWFSRGSWMKSGDITFLSSVGGIGVSHFFAPTTPSGYLFGGVGLASLSAPFESGSGANYGLGLVLGAGYEFSPHWSFEGVLAYAKTTEDEFPTIWDVDTKTLTFGATFNYLWY